MSYPDFIQAFPALDLPLPESARPIGLTLREGWMPTPTQARFLDLLRAAATDGDGV